MKNVIVKTKLVTIFAQDGALRFIIKMGDGKSIEHQPFTADVRGTVAALLLAADVEAGKFAPLTSYTEEPHYPQLTNKARGVLSINAKGNQE